jgi:hypothetical protein
MRHISRLLAALAACACNPDLATPTSGCPDPAADEASALEVTLEPGAPLDRAPTIMRVHVRGVEAAVDPARLLLVEGEVGPSHLGQIARDEISSALSERIVPTLVWSHDNEVVLAPTRALAPGDYSVASGAPKASVPIVVAEDDPVPRLAFMFPPGGESAGRRLGVWCGAEFPPIALPIVLSPGEEEALLRSGAIADIGRGCVHLEAQAGTDPVVPPPALVKDDGEVVARIEPVALRGGLAPPTWAPRTCEADEIRFGPGCARVFDDRMRISTPDTPLLWAIVASGLDVLHATNGAPALVSPLQPSTALTLWVAAVDVAGSVHESSVAIVTLPPMAHVVIHEVLANPKGPEPEQEWVELYNDGLVSASLGGYVLGDVGGTTPLPAGELAPGGYALVVNESFDELADYDPRPAPGTLVLRVPDLGKNGLSNEGEPLTLIDTTGTIVSKFPALPKPKAGHSVMRVDPKAMDDDPDSFVHAPELPTPGAANL